MTLHHSTFEYAKPTDHQINVMASCRCAVTHYAEKLESLLPEGPDKTYILRRVRETAMWVNTAITRLPDGSPRDHPPEPHDAPR